MNFSVDTHTWFIITVILLTTLSLLIVGFIAIPYFNRKKQHNRKIYKRSKKENQLKSVDQKVAETEVSNLEQRNQILETDLKKSLSELLRSDLTQADFNSFFAEFEKIHPNFNETLIKFIPDITAYELKLCSLIRMNLSAKEISGLMNITPASVNTARYRLRKKINLDSKEDLDLFIINI